MICRKRLDMSVCLNLMYEMQHLKKVVFTVVYILTEAYVYMRHYRKRLSCYLIIWHILY